MFNSVIACGGRVARPDLDPSQVLKYLIARSSQPPQPQIDMIAQPTELVPVLLRSSTLVGLQEEFDLVLEQIDHLALNAYLPSDYTEFGADQITGGANAVFHVGHDFWRVSDLEAAWPEVLSPETSGVAMTALLASLLFPDRSPWFLLPDPSHGSELSSYEPKK